MGYVIGDMKELLKKLQNYNPNNLVFNQYSNKESKGLIRLNNLKIYLKSINPKLVLVGEAPGFNGCRWSGIPFTSEYLMMKGDISIFKTNKGFKQTSDGKLKKEISAKIVWEVINTFKQIPLLWNIFPFHPYQKSMPHKNRKPSSEETEEGSYFLEKIKNIFSDAKFIAVGKVAHNKLKDIGIIAEEVRHPSFGGKALFQKQIIRFKN